MQAALRPYATAGVALVGASVIAVSPIAVTPTDVQEIRDRAVELSALVNPIDAFRPVFEATLTDLQALGEAIRANPAPILAAILANQPGNIAGFPGAVLRQILELPQIPGQIPGQIGDTLAGIQSLVGPIQTFLQGVITAITSTDVNAGGVLVRQLQSIITALQDGDFGLAFGNLSVLPLAPILNPLLNNITLLPQIASVFQQQLANVQELLPIASGPLTTAQQVVSVFANDPTALLLVGIGPLLAVNGVATAAGNTLSGLVDAVQNGDPEVAFNAIVNQAAAAVTAIVNGTLDPGLGRLGGLQHLREEIGTAIGTPLAVADAAALPGGAAQSFTLTAPLEKAPAKAGGATGEASKGSAGDASTTSSGTDTKESTGTTTPTNTKDSAKGGNLFTPGNTATKGGRHRADTGNFTQGLRDTIKGLTGLGRDKQSESSSTASKSGESASSSSASGSASSGGGSEK